MTSSIHRRVYYPPQYREVEGVASTGPVNGQVEALSVHRYIAYPQGVG